MFKRQKNKQNAGSPVIEEPKSEEITTPPHTSTEPKRNPNRHHGPMHLPSFFKHAGESGRTGFHPGHFLHVIGRSSSPVSMAVNCLWPVVPAAIAVHFALPRYHVLIFLLNYIAIVPAANLIGFAGQELARKLPLVFGVIMETTLGSLVEIVLFIILIVKNPDTGSRIVKAAILGSILANLLLCLGTCFIAGAFNTKEQTFHEAVSEVGSGILLVAGLALVIPAAFNTVVGSQEYVGSGETTGAAYQDRINAISRAVAILLLVAFIVYVIFQTTSHHSLYTDVLAADEEADRDRHEDLAKKKLTATECILALLIALTCAVLSAYFLVQQIEFIVCYHDVTDAFMGLILVPLVEKLSEHLTAVDEAYDNQANFALTHVMGASIQTALLNTPIVVLVAWGIGHDMDLNFRPFEAIILILAIIVIGNFLRDGKTNYLEGTLCVIAYVLIAVAAFYYPNPTSVIEECAALKEEAAAGEAPAAAAKAARMVLKAITG